MVHTVVWRVGSEDALDFWEQRLVGEGVATERTPRRLAFSDPEGIGIELAVVETDDEPLVAESPEIPREHALQGFDGVRAFAADPSRSAQLLQDALGFETEDGDVFEVRGARRGGFYAYDPAPEERGMGGAGTVHHVAFASPTEEHEAWRERAREHGLSPTPVIDRFYFKSIYFREPSGVLFEIATLGPGFATDEPAESLGERLSLPPDFEHLRERIEPVLTPIRNPREDWARQG
jgi:glyoxalase family protein